MIDQPSIAARIRALGVGENVLIEGGKIASVASIACRLGKLWSRRYRTNTAPGGVTVWRWEDEPVRPAS